MGLSLVWESLATIGSAAAGGALAVPLARAVREMFRISGSLVERDLKLEESLATLFDPRFRHQINGCFAGDVHPRWQNKGRRHPSNGEPAKAVMDALFSDCYEVPEIRDASGNLIVFGSITSSDDTKAVFNDQNPLGLKFLYYNDDRYQTTDVFRYVGGEKYFTTLRGLYLGNDTGVKYPEVKNGCLDSDILLLTKIPNVFNEIAFHGDGRALIVGGVQGVATESFPRILTRRDIFTDLMSEVGDDEFFQAAIQIRKVTHDDKNSRSLGEGFGMLSYTRLQPGDLYASIEKALGWKII